jgi:hypothetical protein
MIKLVYNFPKFTPFQTNTTRFDKKNIAFTLPFAYSSP